MFRRSALIAVATFLFSTSSLFAQLPSVWHFQVGYTQLLNEFGLVADGSGLAVAQVEALEAGLRFMPDAMNADFAGKAFTQGSPGSALPSGHATGVGAGFYGLTNSIAPGITNITGFDANEWLGVKLGFDLGVDPLPQNFAVSNHSYVGSGLTVADATNLLQRFDFAVNQTGMIAVVGVANSGSLPQLLAPAYNSISVGRTNGSHSFGTTTFYGAGRTKPEIVAPATSTSQATGWVSSGASLIYDAAMGSSATQPEVIKAILLAGATKNEFPTWDRTTTRPLDEVFGAGEMNVYHSYRILAGGETNGSITEPAAPAPNEGWDYNAAAPAGTPIFYDLDVQVGAKDLSVILDWNIDVIDSDPTGIFNPSTILADMDLRLYDSTGNFLNTLLDSSLSTVDNVEHIYQSILGPGRYTLEVRSSIAHDYGIAWRFTAVPEPQQWIALACAGIAGAWFMARRKSRLAKLATAPA